MTSKLKETCAQKPYDGLIVASCLSNIPVGTPCEFTRNEKGWYLCPKSIVFKPFSRLQTNKSNGCNWPCLVLLGD